MEYYLNLLLVLSFVWACIHFLASYSSRRNSGTAGLPPGPRPLPIIGNIHQLGTKPHQSLANLSKIYGHVMSLKLGSATTIVVSSSEAAKQVLHTNDHVLAGRPVPTVGRVLDHHMYSLLWLPVCDQWRYLRKICAIQMFVAKQLNASEDLRRKKVGELLEFVHESYRKGVAVDLGRAAFTTILNLLSNTFFSIDLADHRSELSQEFKDLVWEVMKEAGRTNLADYFPTLGWADPQGISRQTKIYFEKLLGIFDEIIAQRSKLRAASSSPSARNDVLDALLLNVENDPEFGNNDLRNLILDLFLAGTDTTSTMLEWAMAELLHNPEKISKAQTEVREFLGEDMFIQESDISKLPYLQAVVKEALRLHPPAPLMAPHKAETDTEICYFKVPKNTRVVVNVWAISRDPKFWSHPNSFVPERFLESKIDYKGQDLELIPFGAGRRICPGLPLAYRMMHIVLASLLRSFDWKLEGGMKPEDMDMAEKFGITLKIANPVLAIPIKV